MATFKTCVQKQRMDGSTIDYNFSMDFQIDYLGQPLSTFVNAYFIGQVSIL